MDFVILAAGWLLYFILHSVLAAEVVKRLASRWMGSAFRFYRIIYSLIAVTGLLFLLLMNGSIPSPYFFESKGIVRYLSLMVTTFGVMTIQLAFRQYQLTSFLGLKQEPAEFKADGILKVVRHPIYSGLILVTLGFFLFIPNLPTLISCAAIFIYLPLGMYLEEKKLVTTYGEKYLNYRLTVPALIPKFGLLSRRQDQL